MSREFWEKLTSSTQTAPTRPPIIVQSGDTLAALGEQHGFDWRDVTIVRDGRPYPVGAGGISPSQLRPGDQIIPAGQPASDEDVEETCTNCCDRPVWMDTAEAELGTTELKGEDESNSRIEEYHDSGTAAGRSDGTAWCASFVNWVFENTINPKTARAFHSINSAGARHYLDSKRYNAKDESFSPGGYGEPSDPFVGAIIAYVWKETQDSQGNPAGAPGHVGFIVGETNNGRAWWVLGGNQANEQKTTELVCVASYGKSAGIAQDIRKPPGFAPCADQLEIPKYTRAQAERKFTHVGRPGSLETSR